MIVTDPEKLRRIRHLNDLLRCKGIGGEVLVSVGVDQLGTPLVVTALLAVAAYSAFNAETDPHGERDFGLVEAAGTSIIWKIDYFDRSLSCHSPDPSDPAVTRRVMTLMLASEY